MLRKPATDPKMLNWKSRFPRNNLAKAICSQQATATPPIIDSDYDKFEEAVGWRHLHAWNRLEF